MPETTRRRGRAFTVLEVASGNALALAGFKPLRTRAEIYQLRSEDLAGPARLLDRMDECVPLTDHVRAAFETYRDEAGAAIDALEEDGDEAAIVAVALRRQLAKLPQDPDHAARLWLAGMPEEDFAPLWLALQTWLAEGPDWDYEEDYFPNPVNGREAALRLMETETGDLLEALGIALVYGDRPGSSYCAAELEKSVEDANRIAVKIGCDYRFVRQAR